ncbi:Deoxyribonuclease-1 [Mizuhopecten yessoensis]|uniref:Deoxyribonuclease-1 n=1 Tax=Mizuhopecten yessoensis TaxID=6573 RepID=A0A210PFP7_MIZYE|nr:Deoxyribonuclease-1 [Mizuhopecten yessoensis]
MASVLIDKFLFGVFFFLTLQFNVWCSNRMLEPNLRIAAFNLKVFGDKKLQNSDVVNILVKIIKRYDITIVQEIRDIDGSSFKTLMEKLNSQAMDPEYASVLSDRLGKTNSKEEYGMIYRKGLVLLVDTYQYPDPSYTFFERPPFAFRVRTNAVDLDEFAIIAIHTKPENAVEEIKKLVDVYQNTSDHWNGLKNILIAGDFNAGCRYVTASEMKTIALRNDPSYTWLIGDNVDTTTYNSDCAYDRFVVAGDALKAAIVPGTARVFRFDEEYKLTEEETKDVSDHYPIEVDIRGKVDRSELDKFHSYMSMSFQDITVHPKSAIEQITRSLVFKKNGFSISYEMSSKVRAHAKASLDNKTKSEILTTLERIHKDSSPLITEQVLELTELYLNSPIMNGIPGAHGFLVPYNGLAARSDNTTSVKSFQCDTQHLKAVNVTLNI